MWGAENLNTIGREKWEWGFGKQLVLAQLYCLAPDGASLYRIRLLLNSFKNSL